MTTPAQKQTILIVEDEVSLRNALRDKCTREGFTVLEAQNGAEGLERARKEHPDLILLDLLMPVMDGLTMLNRLRDDPWGAKVPVIILSNLSDSSAVAQALASGTHDYLVKTDWKLEEVVAKVKERLDM
jgi:DNA-binding response OmpR family regulator